MGGRKDTAERLASLKRLMGEAAVLAEAPDIGGEFSDVLRDALGDLFETVEERRAAVDHDHWPKG